MEQQREGADQGQYPPPPLAVKRQSYKFIYLLSADLGSEPGRRRGAAALPQCIRLSGRRGTVQQEE